MLVFDKAYIETKNKYILTLAKYSVPYRSLRSVNIKSIICSKIKNVEDNGDGSYVLSFYDDTLIKALLGDIQLLYIRAVLQYEDAILSNNIGMTANWNIVTNYYSAFFYASLFLRLNFRGNIFLESKIKQDLEKLISIILENAISLKSNLFYSIYQINDEYVLKLAPSDGNTHEVVWREIDKVVDELILLSRKNSDEYTFLKSLKTINHKLSNTFPSQFRNRVNYQPIYGLDCIEKKLFSVKTNISWVKEIISFDSRNGCDDNKTTNLFSAYFLYFKNFSEKLIRDYYDIKGNENGVISKINKERKIKIELKDIPFDH